MISSLCDARSRCLVLDFGRHRTRLFPSFLPSSSTDQAPGDRTRIPLPIVLSLSRGCCRILLRTPLLFHRLPCNTQPLSLTHWTLCATMSQKEHATKRRRMSSRQDPEPLFLLDGLAELQEVSQAAKGTTPDQLRRVAYLHESTGLCG